MNSVVEIFSLKMQIFAYSGMPLCAHQYGKECLVRLNEFSHVGLEPLTLNECHSYKVTRRSSQGHPKVKFNKNIILAAFELFWGSQPATKVPDLSLCHLSWTSDPP